MFGRYQPSTPAEKMGHLASHVKWIPWQFDGHVGSCNDTVLARLVRPVYNSSIQKHEGLKVITQGSPRSYPIHHFFHVQFPQFFIIFHGFSQASFPTQPSGSFTSTLELGKVGVRDKIWHMSNVLRRLAVLRVSRLRPMNTTVLGCKGEDHTSKHDGSPTIRFPSRMIEFERLQVLPSPHMQKTSLAACESFVPNIGCSPCRWFHHSCLFPECVARVPVSLWGCGG